MVDDNKQTHNPQPQKKDDVALEKLTAKEKAEVARWTKASFAIDGKREALDNIHLKEWEQKDRITEQKREKSKHSARIKKDADMKEFRAKNRSLSEKEFGAGLDKIEKQFDVTFDSIESAFVAEKNQNYKEREAGQNQRLQTAEATIKKLYQANGIEGTVEKELRNLAKELKAKGYKLDDNEDITPETIRKHISGLDTPERIFVADDNRNGLFEVSEAVRWMHLKPPITTPGNGKPKSSRTPG